MHHVFKVGTAVVVPDGTSVYPIIGPRQLNTGLRPSRCLQLGSEWASRVQASRLASAQRIVRVPIGDRNWTGVAGALGETDRLNRQSLPCALHPA